MEPSKCSVFGRKILRMFLVGILLGKPLRMNAGVFNRSLSWRIRVSGANAEPSLFFCRSIESRNLTWFGNYQIFPDFPEFRLRVARSGDDYVGNPFPGQVPEAETSFFSDLKFDGPIFGQKKRRPWKDAFGLHCCWLGHYFLFLFFFFLPTSQSITSFAPAPGRGHG